MGLISWNHTLVHGSSKSCRSSSAAWGWSHDKARSDTGTTPLHLAAKNGHLEVVRLLIEAGVDINKARTNDGATPLHIATQKGHVEVVSLLSEAGATRKKARTAKGWLIWPKVHEMMDVDFAQKDYSSILYFILFVPMQFHGHFGHRVFSGWTLLEKTRRADCCCKGGWLVLRFNVNGWIWLEFAPISVPRTLVNIILHGSRPKYLVIYKLISR